MYSKMTQVLTQTKSNKKTMPLTQSEVKTIKDKMFKAKSVSQFSLKIGIERTTLITTIARGSGSPATVKIIREFLQKKTA